MMRPLSLSLVLLRRAEVKPALPLLVLAGGMGGVSWVSHTANFLTSSSRGQGVLMGCVNQTANLALD